MFQWLMGLVCGRGNAECFEELFLEDDGVTGYLDSISPSYKAWRESQEKRDLLTQKLNDAEWILEYERKLAALEKEIAEESRRATTASRSSERLLKLNRYLAHLRDSLG